MNVAHFLLKSSCRKPHAVAWRYGEQHATYAEVTERVSRIAGALEATGLQRGDRIALVIPNRPELLEMLFACWWGGYVAVPVNWHLHPQEIDFILRDSGAAAVLVSKETRDVLNHRPVGSSLMAIDVDLVEDDAASWARLTTSGSSSPIADVDAAELAWLFYTSGTTGRPKGAMLSHRSLVNLTFNFFSDIDGVQPDSVFLHAAPLTHGSGLYLLPSIARAATNVISPSHSFDPDQYLDLVETHRATHGAFLASTMLKRIVESRRARSSDDLSSLKLVVIGGGPIYEADLREAVDVLGPIVVQMYGQGEAPMTIAVMPPAELHRALNLGRDDRLLSCGRPYDGVAVRIVSPGGSEVPAGLDGEVWVRGDVLMSGYWKNESATAAALVDGWLRTGDIGHFDDEGFLYLTDRAKDVIITGGSNVYPREVEEVLMKHPAVQEAAVVGVPDAEWGEAVTAYVVLRDSRDVTEADLIEFTRAHVASFKKPRRVLRVDALPKNPSGKVLRRELRVQPAEVFGQEGTPNGLD